MLLFFAGPFFERRRRRGHARDEMPLRPLLNVLMFWLLFTTGGLFAALAGAACFAALALHLPLDRLTLVSAVAMAVCSPLCLWFSVRYLWKLTRTRH